MCAASFHPAAISFCQAGHGLLDLGVGLLGAREHGGCDSPHASGGVKAYWVGAVQFLPHLGGLAAASGVFRFLEVA
jgi:hypothetical protein